jgi:two-component system, OmpR family, phosphate regulon sensor histidine kinase PhoR
LNKTRAVFTGVTIYIISAFIWWTYAHVRSSKVIYAKDLKILELDCYRATVDINGAIAQELFNDSNGVKAYFEVNFPQLEIVFDETTPELQNFLIRPKKEAYVLLKAKQQRQVLMYITEALVMMGLLFWGIIWIYRNLQNRLKLKKQQSNFLLSITHELKTPIASIKLYLETLRKRDLPKEQSSLIILNSLNDVERLRDLVENVLLAAQLDSHKYEPQLFETNLSELITDIVNRYSTPRNLESRLNLNIEKDVFLTTDKEGFEVIVNNLLSNAVKYSPADGKIDLLLRTDGKKVTFSVSDEGIGVSAADKEMLFNQFYRAGDEETRKSKGTGLGLFIVKNLLNILGGEIKVKDKQNKGTTFELSFNYE